ncbi:TetR/AcrR family transcriptional regulator [Kineosporia rhizophila]|uniref:TetR/AcrR family transcriptional regulator n=1 Tax=Kineosporia TaxID=49184 RepID=UPI000B21BD31|nr:MULTISPECIES: TetR/AcrR family transcriptional regulator [Kineosporia]MCE0534986.1 TetR/AcrR family transcriptional regulator [Kineosporia rhizophila]GLY14730.1 TetR family transcriptional regulator [Kineosporia sp. NBRC 101677]
MGEDRGRMCRPLRKDAERNRQRILTAARTLLAEQGLGVSHDQLAEAADVAVGTVYRRFPDKDSLLEALFAEDVDQVVELAERALEVEDAWQGLVTFVTRSLEVQAGNRGLKEFLMFNVTSDTMTTCRARLLPLIDQIVARGHAAGVLRPGITSYDLGMIPLMVGPVMDGCRAVRPDLWRRSLEIVLAGLQACQEKPRLADSDLHPEEFLEVLRCAQAPSLRR